LASMVVTSFGVVCSEDMVSSGTPGVVFVPSM
jgi:hypothetical protein